jgi:hypothetical protein
VVGSQRPSVTTALSALKREGLVERLPDGSWLLHGEPPQELGRVQDSVGGKPLEEDALA